MARPSKFDRSKAIETAMNAIWSDGYEASSVKALSERLGITRSSFYNAFGSREELFEEAFEAYARISPDRSLSEAIPGDRLRPLLTRITREICHVRGTDPQARGCLIINTVAQRCPQDVALSQLLCGAVMNSVAHLETLLKGAVEAGELDPDTDTRATALAIQNMIVGLNVMAKVTRNEADLWTIAAATLKGFGLYDEIGLSGG